MKKALMKTKWMRHTAMMLAALAFPATAMAQLNPVQFGHLNQRSMNGVPAGWGNWACGPVAAANALVYVRNNNVGLPAAWLVPVAVTHDLRLGIHMNTKYPVDPITGLPDLTHPGWTSSSYMPNQHGTVPGIAPAHSGGTTYQRLAWGIDNYTRTMPNNQNTPLSISLKGQMRQLWVLAGKDNMPKPAWLAHGAAPTQAWIQGQLMNGRPVVIGFQWFAFDPLNPGVPGAALGGGHYVTLYHFNAVTNNVSFIDPWGGIPALGGGGIPIPDMTAPQLTGPLVNVAGILYFRYANGAAGGGAFGRIDIGVSLLPGPCLADVNGDAAVNVNDLLAVINAWGPCPLPCPPRCAADIAPPPGGNCTVNVNDLLAVINGWGPCP